MVLSSPGLDATYKTGEPAKQKRAYPGLAGTFLADGSSKTVLVELRGSKSLALTLGNSI
jgi:hypothetical protein